MGLRNRWLWLILPCLSRHRSCPSAWEREREAELPRSPPELEARFPDGAACASWPLAKRWPDGFPFPVHPHVLRRACGFELANDGKDTRALQERLGHSNIQHTELTSKWFKNFWEGED